MTRCTTCGNLLAFCTCGLAQSSRLCRTCGRPMTHCRCEVTTLLPLPGDLMYPNAIDAESELSTEARRLVDGYPAAYTLPNKAMSQARRAAMRQALHQD